MSAPDNWIHRSVTMTCCRCMYYVQKLRQDGVTLPEYEGLGRCRRHAPTMGGWPAVYGNDWCGDHKLDVDKL